MIRHATPADLTIIMEIYRIAREYMQKNGNPTQWGKAGYPSTKLLKNDIQNGNLYVYEEDGIHGVFAFILGEDPTYGTIEGAWINNEPYGTIHRIASDMQQKGVFEKCLDFCKDRADNIRIDTHKNNATMRHLIEKNGFQECGIIHVQDGSPRIAYQYTKPSDQSCSFK